MDMPPHLLQTSSPDDNEVHLPNVEHLSAAEHLEALSCTLITCVNRVPLSHPFLQSHVGPDFRMQGESFNLTPKDIWPLDPVSHIAPSAENDYSNDDESRSDECSSYGASAPPFQLEATSALAEVEEGSDYGTVYVTTRCNRARFDFERECVTKLSWRRMWKVGKKVWVCQTSKTMKYGGVDVIPR